MRLDAKVFVVDVAVVVLLLLGLEASELVVLM